MEDMNAALEFWKALDLDSRRTEWDDQGLEMAENQERSKRSRREIADLTKGYQRCPPEEKKTKAGAVLKRYQVEIDALTTRAKYAEGAFLSTYKLFYDAPDPSPALQRAADNAEQIAQFDKVQAELREYQDEFNSLKNQEITVKNLEQELEEAREGTTDQNREAVEAARADWKEDLRTLELQQLEKEQQLLDRLNAANKALQIECGRREQREAALLDVKQQLAHGDAGRQAEDELVTAELDRATNDQLMLKAENDNLKAQLTLLKEDASSKPEVAAGHLGDHVSHRKLEQQAEAVRLAHTEIMTLKSQIGSSRGEMAAVQSELRGSQKEVQVLHTQIGELPTAESYNAMKEQLRTWKIAMLGILDAPEEQDNSQEGDLSNVLLARNRKLEDELTKNKVASQEQSAELEASVAEVERLQNLLASTQHKMSTLEQQLLSMDSTPVSAPADGNAKAAEGSIDVEDVQTVLQRQRDLLRARCDELQHQANASEKKLVTSTTEAERLKNDNMELYRKIKYLQSYSASGGKPVDMEDGNIREYRKAYEQSENPFSEFRKREKQSAMQSLNIAERMTHSGVTLIVNHKVAMNVLHE